MSTDNKMVNAILECVSTPNTMRLEQLDQMVIGAAYALGGLLCHYPAEARGEMIMRFNHALVTGMTNTSVSIGEKESYDFVTNMGNGQRRK